MKYKIIEIYKFIKHNIFCGSDGIKYNVVLYCGGKPFAVYCKKCGFGFLGTTEE